MCDLILLFDIAVYIITIASSFFSFIINASSIPIPTKEQVSQKKKLKIKTESSANKKKRRILCQGWNETNKNNISKIFIFIELLSDRGLLLLRKKRWTTVKNHKNKLNNWKRFCRCRFRLSSVRIHQRVTSTVPGLLLLLCHFDICNAMNFLLTSSPHQRDRYNVEWHLMASIHIP